jgi:hypothetical protein
MEMRDKRQDPTEIFIVMECNCLSEFQARSLRTIGNERHRFFLPFTTSSTSTQGYEWCQNLVAEAITRNAGKTFVCFRLLPPPRTRSTQSSYLRNRSSWSAIDFDLLISEVLLTSVTCPSFIEYCAYVQLPFVRVP